MVNMRFIREIETSFFQKDVLPFTYTLLVASFFWQRPLAL